MDGGSGDSDNNENKDVVARIFAHPFKNTASDTLRGLGVGFAYTTGNQRSSPPTGNLPSYRTPGQQVFFTYNTGAIANGNRERFAPQAYWYSGPFGALGEFVLSRQEVARGTNQLEAEGRAWQVALYWVPTGEDASFRGITPRTSFDPANGTWGALELVARYSEQTVADEVFAGPAATRLADPTRSARKATDIGLGVNWYWNRNVKVQLTYDRTRFKGGAATGDRPDENVLFARLQLSF